MASLKRTVAAVLWALAGLSPGCGAAIDRPYPGPSFEDDRLLMVLIPRTPEQMAAFYEARGFPPAALERIRHTCFITVHIENRGPDVLWLNLDDWRFSSDGKTVPRLDEDWWEGQWNEIGLRQASRSTFGWTQLPQLRDLRHDEPVGGNVVFPGDIRAVTIDAVFHIGADRSSNTIRLGFGQVPCSNGAQQP